MAQTRESRPAPAQPNIQDVFLNHARREKLPVQIRLMDGTDFEGRVKNLEGGPRALAQSVESVKLCAAKVAKHQQR